MTSGSYQKAPVRPFKNMNENTKHNQQRWEVQTESPNQRISDSDGIDPVAPRMKERVTDPRNSEWASPAAMKYVSGASADGTEPPWSNWLSREDAVKLLEVFRPADQPGFTEEEAERLFAWVEKIRIGSTMLELALEGKLEIFVKDSDIAFRTPPSGLFCDE
jgi:hypothetical protein